MERTRRQMDHELKNGFMKLWKKHFGRASLPIAFYYAEDVREAHNPGPPSGHRCVIADLMRVASGDSVALNLESIGCGGGKRYLGFAREIMPNFEYFLSCGIPGKLEGERYKKSPELVREAMAYVVEFEAPAKYIIFKRWDKLQEADDPDVVTFFGTTDVLSGLFTLANFDEADPNGVFAPFSAGCGSIVQYPYLEKDADRPRAVLGMFDVSARPFIPVGLLSFSVPWVKFVRMVSNMDESFLTTECRSKVKRRIRET